MQSIKELFKIGNGPSSSHTMGPKKAVELFKNSHNELNKIKVILYGSLALTGKGHLTDYIIKETLKPLETIIEFDTKAECKIHPNTMDIIGYKDEKIVDSWRVYSIGGGSIKIEGKDYKDSPDIYNLTKFDQISEYCKQNNKSLSEFVYEVEESDFKEYLRDIWNTMKNSVEEGLTKEGILPGALGIEKKAKKIFEKKIENETSEMLKTRLLTAYAQSVSEMNSSGGIIVTAPTCGASGILPSVLYYSYKQLNFSEEKITDALAVAGLIGNLVKTNASISGAECGCQAEVGTACSMAAAAYATLNDWNIDIVESAAEVAMEHHLGLTCDPVQGYVQIPCIERNAVASIRAIDSANVSFLIGKKELISFDTVVDTMYETGKDLKSHYRETSEGGLAKKYCRNKYYNHEIK